MASDGELISLQSSTLGSINQVVKKVSLLNQNKFGDESTNGTLTINEIEAEKALIFDEIQRICEGYIKAISKITQ